jgi:chromosome segregation ATPase
VDAETRAYLDAFRLEFRRDLAEAMTTLRAEMATTRQESRADLAEALASMRDENRAHFASRADLAEAMASLREETRAHFASRADLAEAMATLRAEIRSEAAETRRHFDVVAEGLRGDIRLVAEGVVANTESIERLRSDVTREMDERFRVVNLAIGELRTRIR